MLSHVQILCNTMDCSPPGSSVRGIFQARILEWVAISSSRGSSQPRDQTWVSCVSCIGSWILPLSHLQDYMWYLLVNWWVSVVSTFWFLEIALLWIFAQELLGGHKFSFLLGLCVGVELLGHTITLWLNFWGCAKLFSKAGFLSALYEVSSFSVSLPVCHWVWWKLLVAYLSQEDTISLK